MTIFAFFIIHKLALAFGFASSVIVDIFLIFVEKTKKITGIEKKIINRTLSYSFLFSAIVFISQIYLLIVALQNNFLILDLGFYVFTSVLSFILLILTALQKYYQIELLYRQQEKYHHLSDSFVNHHKELNITAILTICTWLILYICYVIVI